MTILSNKNRRSIRLPGYDYSCSGAYYITICTHDRLCLFGKITDGKMVLNEYGKSAYEEWFALRRRYDCFQPDAFQIMPNHIHAILIINTVGAGLTPAQSERATARVAPTQIDNVRVAPTLGEMVGAYKSLVYKRCLDLAKSRGEILGKIWQRNYYEHIVRDGDDHERIANYIQDNPLNWKRDGLYF